MRLFYSTYFTVCFAFLFFVAFPAHADFPEPEAAFTVVMEPPEGYVEITQEKFPEYLKAVAEEVYYPQSRLRRLFLPKADLPYLEAGEFDKLTASAILSERDPSFIEVLGGEREAAKFLKEAQEREKNIDRAVDMDRLKAWMDNTSLNKNPLVFDPIALRGLACMVVFSATSKMPGISMGIKERDIAVAVYSFSSGQKRFDLTFTRTLNKPEDVKTVANEALTYSQDCTRQFSCVPASPLADYEVPYSLLAHQACFFQGRGETDKAQQAYKQLWDSADKMDEVGYMIQIIAASRVSKCFAQSGQVKEAIAILTPAVEKAQTNPTATSARLAVLLGLGFYQMQAGEFENAWMTLENALRQPAEDTTDEKTLAAAQKLLFFTLVNLGNFHRSGELLAEVFAEAVPFSYNGMVPSDLLYRMGFTCFHQNMPRTAIFLFKMGLAQMRFEEEQQIPNNKDDKEALFKTLRLLLSITHRKGEMEQIEKWRLSDTTAALMTGDEVAVYARYEEAADALRNAVQSGSENKIKKARADFLTWLQSTERTLDGSTLK